MSDPESKVRVKPLEWTGRDYIRKCEHAYTHDTGMYCYTVKTDDSGRWWRGITNIDGVTYHSEGGTAGAKAVCQADYEARIRSALIEPTP